MSTAEIIQLTIAVYLLTFGLVVRTKNFISALIFNVIPVASFFVLGLVAFKVIV